MENPIIQYGQQRDASIIEARNKELLMRAEKIKQLNFNTLSQFEEVFKDYLPAIKASGVIYSPGVQDETRGSDSRYIHFHTEEGRECKIEWAGPNHYRYFFPNFAGEHGPMQFGAWPPEELLGYLYDQLFVELPF